VSSIILASLASISAGSKSYSVFPGPLRVGFTEEENPSEENWVVPTAILTAKVFAGRRIEMSSICSQRTMRNERVYYNNLKEKQQGRDTYVVKCRGKLLLSFIEIRNGLGKRKMPPATFPF